jgi:aspartate ammonia-lyase
MFASVGSCKVSSKKLETRLERDSLGQIEVPISAYWGPRTARWLGGRRPDQTFKSRQNFHPYLIEGLSTLYKARLKVDHGQSPTEPTFSRIKSQVCDEILSGQWRNEFVVSPTSSADGAALLDNMEEVVERRALEIVGNLPGAGNSSTSLIENNLPDVLLREDSFMTGAKLALLIASREMAQALLDLERLLRRKSLEFEKALRARGLDSSSELALARDFNAFGNAAGRHLQRLHLVEERLVELSIKAASKESRCAMLQELQQLTGFKLKAGEESGLGSHTQAGAADILSASSFIRDLSNELLRLALGLSTLKAVTGNVSVLASLQLNAISVLALDFAAATAIREPIVSTGERTFAQALAAQATVEAFCNLSAAIKYFNQEYLLIATLA